MKKKAININHLNNHILTKLMPFRYVKKKSIDEHINESDEDELDILFLTKEGNMKIAKNPKIINNTWRWDKGIYITHTNSLVKYIHKETKEIYKFWVIAENNPHPLPNDIDRDAKNLAQIIKAISINYRILDDDGSGLGYMKYLFIIIGIIVAGALLYYFGAFDAIGNMFAEKTKEAITPVIQQNLTNIGGSLN